MGIVRGLAVKSILFCSILLTCQLAMAERQEWIYIVNEGDTLWHLSEKYFPNVSYWQKFQKLNNISQPKKIKPGTRLRVPLAWLSDQIVPAKITAVNGTAVLTAVGSQQAQELFAGMVIHLGDQLRTEAETCVVVEFADGSTVTVHQETSVFFDHLSAYSDTGMVDTRLRMLSGRMDVHAKPATGPGSRFQIQTPAAISAVRGTEYRTDVGDGGTTSTIEVLEGRVAATGGKKTRQVRASFGTKVHRGKPPIPPRPLLKAPQFKAIPDTITRLNWPLLWKAVTGADRYRIEVSGEADFQLILWERFTGSPRTPLPDLPDGNYFVRVRGIDELGIEGLNQTQPFELDARPQPPVPLAPVDAAVIRGSEVTLSWTESAEASQYRLQVSVEGSDFEELLVDIEDLTDASHTSDIETGSYQWRLASISYTGEQGPYGMTRFFEIKPVPLVSLPATLEGDDEIIQASWQPGAEGQTYHIQLAEDAEFTTLLMDEYMTDSQLELKQIEYTTRYLRISIVEPDGYQGPWGATQKIAPLPEYGWIYMLGLIVLGIVLL